MHTLCAEEVLKPCAQISGCDETVCTRVLVFRDGRIAAELCGADITIERLLALAAGAAATPPLPVTA